MTMANLYRIEIDVFLEDWRRSKVIQAAREHYRNSSGAWTFENGQKVKITAGEFVVDTKTAFLELAESAFRSALPDIEPHAFRCGIAESEFKMRAYDAGRPSLNSRKCRIRSGC